MLLWTLPWTTQVLLALLTSSAPSPTYQEWAMEGVLDVFVLIPSTILLGQVFIRVAASLSVPKPLQSTIPPAIWTPFCQLVTADVLFYLLLKSVAGRVDISQPITSSTGWDNNWGWNGPFNIFTLRLLLSLMGLTVGEAFFPLALTGGIACGKSTISHLLQQRNKFKMIDADKIGHQILLPPWHEDLQKEEALVSPGDSVYIHILTAFAGDNETKGEGSAVAGVNDNHPLLDPETKCIDRAKLGAKVFGNDEARRKLNAITHKRIFYCLLKSMAKHIYFGKKETTYVCAEIPLLFESGPLRYVFGLALCVACTPTQQLERLKKRNPELSPKDCQNRIDSQMPMATKVQKADIVLWNDKDYSSSKEDEGDDAKAKQEAALAAQTDLAVRKIQQRVRGVLDTNLTQMLILLSGSLVVSGCFKLYMGTA